MSTGQISLYIATSVDGYVADKDGSVYWLDESQTEESDAICSPPPDSTEHRVLSRTFIICHFNAHVCEGSRDGFPTLIQTRFPKPSKKTLRTFQVFRYKRY
jgi:hypothetical protein